MKKNILNSFYLTMVCLLLFACKAKQKATQIGNSDATTDIITKKSTNFPKIVSKETDFNTFTTKANTQLNIKGKSYDVTLNMRIKKGEGIWVSVTYFAGVEVARTLITPDSIKVMDKINDEYLKKPFSFIHGFTNEEINYQTLEAVLVGNCIPFTLDKKNLVEENGQDVINGRNQEMLYKVTFNNDFKPALTQLHTIDNFKSLSVNISSFESISNALFPKLINVSSASGEQTVTLDMEYTKTQLNEHVDFPFNVPKRFSVID